MRSYTTRQFRQLFASLPRQTQRQARQAYRLFRDNPTHPGLHIQTRLSRTAALFRAHQHWLPCRGRSRWRHDHVVLDRITRQLRQATGRIVGATGPLPRRTRGHVQGPRNANVGSCMPIVPASVAAVHYSGEKNLQFLKKL